MANRNDSYFFGEALEPGNEEQLLIHSYAYADRWDVVQQVNKPAKHSHNPVLMPDQPWEQAVGMPNVLYDEEEGIFRMWYALYDSAGWGGQYLRRKDDIAPRRYSYMISYAEGPDGIHWTKPLLDRIPYVGFAKTNIIFTGKTMAQEFHVLHSPEPVRERGRFMLWYRDKLEEHGMCVNVAFSDNGIDWTEHENNPIYKAALDMESCPVYDDRRGIWLLYARPQALAVKEPLLQGENIRTRCSVTVSEDLKTWAPARIILAPDELDGQFFFDRMSAMKYGNQFVGFVTVQPRDGDGSAHIELVSSADGLTWYRSPIREPFIGPGRDGDWDGGHTWMLPTLTSVGEWIYMYYVGSRRTWRTRFPENTKAIGMARMRRGRFAGQYADINGGYLLSREVKVAGNRLVVNVAPRHRAFNRQEHGNMKVELFDRTSSPYTESHAIEGFSFDDCNLIRTNSVEIPVIFNGNPDISTLMGKNVYLRFFLKDLHLFGFQFVNV